jgi:hypothetical protein
MSVPPPRICADTHLEANPWQGDFPETVLLLSNLQLPTMREMSRRVTVDADIWRGRTLGS